MDIDYTVGAELEFYICGPNGENIADLNSGKFPQKRFEILSSYQNEVYALVNELTNSSYQIEKESGPGQFEVQFKPYIESNILSNEISKFKELSQEAAAKHNLLITFAAKPFEGYTGSGLHIHFSSSVFDPYGLIANNGVVSAKRDFENKYILWAIGGMLKRAKQHDVIFFPNDQSRKRLVPYLNAPTKLCWGRNNRSCAIRIPDSKPKRIEHRMAGSDTNAKMVIEAVIEDGIYGINNRAEPLEPVFGNAWDKQYLFETI